MSITETLVAKFERLTPSDQAKVLAFVESLPPTPTKRQELHGMFAHLGIDISEEEFKAARREAWKNFPRDIEI